MPVQVRLSAPLLFLLLASVLVSKELWLKATYDIKSNQITARMLFDNINKDFIISQFQANSSRKQIKAKKLFKIFADQGFKLNSQSNYIVFNRISNFDQDAIKNAILAYYQQYYSNINITNIEVKSFKIFDQKDFELDHIEFHNNTFKANRGNFTANYMKNTKQSFKVSFNFKIQANISVIKITSDLKPNTVLNQNNTAVKTVIFNSFYDLPVKNIQDLQTKGFVKSGNVLLENMVKIKPLVKKGQEIMVQMISNGIKINFYAKTLEDGLKNSFINVANKKGNILRVKIINNNLAELQ